MKRDHHPPFATLFVMYRVLQFLLFVFVCLFALLCFALFRFVLFLRIYCNSCILSSQRGLLTRPCLHQFSLTPEYNVVLSGPLNTKMFRFSFSCSLSFLTLLCVLNCCCYHCSLIIKCLICDVYWFDCKVRTFCCLYVV